MSQTVTNPFHENRNAVIDYGAIPGGQGFCAIGYNNNDILSIFTSSDGINWMNVSSNSFTIKTQIKLKYGENRGWLASGFDEGSNLVICKSANTSIWYSTTIERSLGYSIIDLNILSHGALEWLIKGCETGNDLAERHFIRTSSDGSTWIDASSNLTQAEISNMRKIEYGIITGGPGWLASGYNPVIQQPLFSSSPDAITWTTISTHPFTTSIQDLKFGKIKVNGTLVPGWLAFGEDSSGTILASSQNGSTWTTISNPFRYIWRIFRNDQYWCINAKPVDGLDTEVLATSPDGITWTISSSNPCYDYGINSIAYGSNTWCIIGGSQVFTRGKIVIFTSPDTNNWTLSTPRYIHIGGIINPAREDGSWPMTINRVVTVLIPSISNSTDTVLIGYQKTENPITFSLVALGKVGNTVTFTVDGKSELYLQMVNIVYYSNKADADANTNPIAASIRSMGYINYTLGNIDFGSISGKTSWTLGNTAQVFQNGHVFSPLVDITTFYKVYSLSDPITYYSNKANALANTNSIGSSTLPIIGSVTTGRTGGHTFWSIASNTASYPVTSQVYISGFELAPGSFNLYPAAPPPPLMKVPPITLSYVYYLLPSVNAQMASLARFSANYATLVTLMTLLLRNIVAKPKPIGPTVAQKRQILSLASRIISAATVNNNKTSYNVNLLNQAQLVVCQHILPASTASIQTIIQTLYAKYIGAEAPLVAVQDRAFKLIDLTKTVYARALLVNSAVVVTPTSSAAIVTANKTALTNLNTSVTALKSSLDSMNMAFLTVKGATRTGIQPNIVSATTSVIALAKL